MNSETAIQSNESKVNFYFTRHLTKSPDTFNASIDERDEMYQFFLKNYNADKARAVYHYLTSGKQSMNVITQICNWHFKVIENVSSFLDFASGYGRFTRFLVQELSHDKVWVSDIYADALQFQKDQFGVQAISSAHDPNEFKVGLSFDFIFVASLFSHLPEVTFSQWLRRLYELLSSGGVLVFSVHDNAVIPASLLVGREASNDDSFLFAPVSESGSLDKNEYGCMYVSEAFVGRVVKSISGTANYFRVPKGLWNYQDIYVVTKNSISDFGKLNISSGPLGFLDKFYFTETGDFVLEGWAVELNYSLHLESIEIFINDSLAYRCVVSEEFFERPDVVAIYKETALGYDADSFLKSGFRCCIDPRKFELSLSDVVLVKAVNSNNIECILRVDTLESVLTRGIA